MSADSIEMSQAPQHIKWIHAVVDRKHLLDPKMLDKAQVAKHNSRESCYVIVDGQVYDVTNFLEEHPGGSDTILLYAGRVDTPSI